MRATNSQQTSVLDGALADLLDLGLLAKQAHWNVVGPNFGAVHRLLDELADLARDGADAIAERAVALGHPPDGRAKTITGTSSLPVLDRVPVRDREVVVLFGPILDAVIYRLHGALEAFEQDPVTADLLVGVVAALEKQAWMIRAQGA
jgi:starvation-inducible DNA-binding protein